MSKPSQAPQQHDSLLNVIFTSGMRRAVYRHCLLQARRVAIRMSLLKQLIAPVWNSVATRYRAAVFKELSQVGLRYDDLYDPLKDEDVAEALRRLPPDVVVARNCRLRRATDLDLKHDHLHGELLAKQTPGESYLQEALEEVRKERRERALLGTQPAYTRIYYD